MKTPRPYQTEAARELYHALDDKGEVHPIAAIPTGAGKTMVMNELIDMYLTNNVTHKVLVLSHVKEILSQNYDSISEHFYGVDVGLYSAGLKSKMLEQITVAGIQSACRNPEAFLDFDLIIIDECHRINAKKLGVYRKFLDEVGTHYVGLTATPFRTGHGYLHIGEDTIFNSLVYNLCTIDGFKMLIDAGYLCPLIPKSTNMKMDVSGLKTRMDDFIPDEMSKRFDRESITNKAVNEIIEFGANYLKWLVFAIDINHAEHIAEALTNKGIPTTCVHSKMKLDRDSEIAKFKDGRYRCLVNVDILTTGFDAPDIDLIAMLRPTQSPILHIQTLGRGMRIAEGKDHCLVLDFAGNVMRLGPINDVSIDQKTGTKLAKSMPKVKECPSCQGLLLVQARECEFCGYVFPVKQKLFDTASTNEIIRLDNKPAWHRVNSIHYFIHKKPGKPDMVKISYSCEGQLTFNEYVLPEHVGSAKHFARQWFRLRSNDVMPEKAMDIVRLGQLGKIKSPTSIQITKDGKFNRVTDVRFY